MKAAILNQKSIAIASALALIAAAATVGIYYFYQYQKNQTEVTKIKASPNSAAKMSQQELQTLTAQVGKLTELPQNEEPTIATVADITKLKDQAFFKNAQNGFKVLIYQNAKKVILYDPFTQKIVEITSLNTSSASPQSASSSADTKP